MPDEKMVCKHCGGDSFYVDVTVHDGWVDGAGVFVGDDGKPHFEPSGRVQDVGYDYEIDNYRCGGCEKGHWQLDQLVVRKPAEGNAPIAACGRCDHARADHREARSIRHKVGAEYTRPLMPCDHEGCRCHDYYDVEFADAGQPAELLKAVGHAA